METLSADSSSTKKIKLSEGFSGIVGVQVGLQGPVELIDNKVNMNNFQEVAPGIYNNNLDNGVEDTSDQVSPNATDPDVMNDDSIDVPVDSELESVNSDDLDDGSTYYDDDDENQYPIFDETLFLQAQFDAADLPPGVEATIDWPIKESEKLGSTSSSPDLKESSEEEEQILRKYRQFKCFDTVQDYSDHYFIKSSAAAKHSAQKWAKAIQNDWRILEKDLPETIFVRVYEERMDLLRAVIVGAAGTPYHDGLFFFDVHFPSAYPDVPPKVHYHSGGLRLNPNLYNCGKVCLSLLGTWPGSSNCEQWNPKQSTMLQVLLSIQALVLNAKPFFNEPGYAHMTGHTAEKSSKDYNENTFVLSCKTMLYSLNRPPKHFEDLVVGHFRVRAQAILEGCKEYLKGTMVGGLEEIEEEPEEEQEEQDILNDEKENLKKFRVSLSGVVGNLIPALISNGAKDCEKYIPLGDISRNAPLKLK